MSSLSPVPYRDSGFWTWKGSYQSHHQSVYLSVCLSRFNAGFCLNNTYGGRGLPLPPFPPSLLSLFPLFPQSFMVCSGGLFSTSVEAPREFVSLFLNVSRDTYNQQGVWFVLDVEFEVRLLVCSRRHFTASSLHPAPRRLWFLDLPKVLSVQPSVSSSVSMS